jgi:hypothetical protein
VWVRPIYLDESDVKAMSRAAKVKIATHNAQVAEICR